MPGNCCHPIGAHKRLRIPDTFQRFPRFGEGWLRRGTAKNAVIITSIV